jgi:hypothetical protein
MLDRTSDGKQFRRGLGIRGKDSSMNVVLKVVAVFFVAIAAFLVYAVIHAAASDGGARAGVAIGYIIGAALLTWAAVKLWRRDRVTPVAPQA